MTLTTKRRILSVFFFASISLVSWRIVETFGTREIVTDGTEELSPGMTFEFVDEDMGLRFTYETIWNGIERINIPAYDETTQQHLHDTLYAALIDGQSHAGFLVAYGEGRPAPREAYWFDQIALLDSTESVSDWCHGKTTCEWKVNAEEKLYLHAYTDVSMEFGRSYSHVNEYVFFREPERHYFERILVSDQHLGIEQKGRVPQLVNSITW